MPVMYQILSVVTLSQLTRIFEQRKNYDLRNMIRGSERLLDSLAGALDTDPSFMLAAVRVLELPAPIRDSISNTIRFPNEHVHNFPDFYLSCLFINIKISP